MSHFLISGGQPLVGDIRLQGAKNSALKLLAACLLAEGETTLSNVPNIADVHTMIEMLTVAGATTEWLEVNVVRISVPAELNTDLGVAAAERIRASIVMMGPLVARCGHVRLAMPGGDDIGGRPIDLHIQGLEAMGAKITQGDGWIQADAAALQSTTVDLPFPSVGATENILMAAVLAVGTTHIRNAAREPEISDLADMLNKMGARVHGAGTSDIEIEGVGRDALGPCQHEVIPDRIEAATFLAAVGCAGGQLTLHGVRADHLAMLLAKFTEIGLRTQLTSDGLVASFDVKDRLRATDVATLPYPGVATDYKPFLVAALSIANGTSVVTENMFSSRFRYFDELRLMGANISVDAHHAVVRGVPSLHGTVVRSHDIRGGAALIVAALGAEGESVVSEAQHVTRGYEMLAARLSAVGAQIEFIDNGIQTAS